MLEHKVSARLEHNRVIPREVPRDFYVIWPTAVVKQSPIHWFGGLTRYVEVLWRTTNELRVGVLGIDRGGSDLTLDYARAYSSMPRPLEHVKAARVRSSRLEQGAEFARVLEHRSPLGSSMLVCNTRQLLPRTPSYDAQKPGVRTRHPTPRVSGHTTIITTNR